jgi:deoxyribose-phosphate aldolase
VEEAEIAIEEGADELDMVMNVSAFKSNDVAYLEVEADAISKLTSNKNKTLKIIIESGILTDEEIIKCCGLYSHFPVQFLKTSTGFAEGGVSVESVQLMRKYLPAHIQIKASGGIKTYAFARQLINAGATRLGTSASIPIINGELQEASY